MTFITVVVALGLLAWAAVIIRVSFLPPEARSHWRLARWHRFRWHRLARNLGLAYVDAHLGGLDSRRKQSVVYPKARFRPDAHGWTVRMRLIPGVGRAELEKSAEHLANAWRCHRVGITQPEPGRLLVRAMRRDPLSGSLPSAVLPAFDGYHVTLGMDEWGQLRSATLANLSGSVIGGNPGQGKTVLATSMAVQLASSPAVQLYVLDGKGGADWAPWQDRAIGYAGDDLDAAAAVLGDVHDRMRSRLAIVQTVLGTRNAWRRGPSPSWPLLWVVVDECHAYLDLDSAKAAGREAEQRVRECRALLGQLLRKGRSVLVHTTLIAQKATGTSIPTDLRDLAGLRCCFGVATTEAGVAVLGEDLRRYDSLSPTTLQGGQYAGVATVRLATGADPYTRLRVPDVTEDQADDTAAATARFREPFRVCVACVGERSHRRDRDSGAVCLRCKGSLTDPDPAAPLLVAA
jgi:S-DNA-T family DNA segregation ATPase FtsK/SpoIIIE